MKNDLTELEELCKLVLGSEPKMVCKREYLDSGLFLDSLFVEMPPYPSKEGKVLDVDDGFVYDGYGKDGRMKIK